MKYWTLSAGPEDVPAIERWLLSAHLWRRTAERTFAVGDHLPSPDAPTVLLAGPKAREAALALPPHPLLTLILLAPEATEMGSDRARHARFLSMLAHDMRTPVSLVAGALGEVRREDRSLVSDTFHAALGLAERGVRRMLRQTANLDTLASLETGTLTLSRTPADLRALVRAGLEQAQGLENKTRLALEVSLPEEACPVEVDAPLITRAIAELVYHAMRHARAAVRLAVAPGPGGPTLVISHDGDRPLPRDGLPTLRTYLPEDAPDADPGERLALALVSEVVRLHEGGLEMAPADDGPGVVVRLSL